MAESRRGSLAGDCCSGGGRGNRSDTKSWWLGSKER